MQLRHGRIELALHELRGGTGPGLLLLHSLWGSSGDWGDEVAGWPGPVHALDLAGHGSSGWLRGGSYSPEQFASDADAAIAELGPVRLAGAGVGAYAALLLAGARPDQVPAALLLPGSGLEGGGPVPDFLAPAGECRREVPEPRKGCDPLLVCCTTDLRPPDYARSFAERARRLLLDEGGSRPAWWEALRGCPTTEAAPANRLDAFAQLAP